MLDDQVLSRITGTLVRGTERIATKDVLTILGIEQRETKRKETGANCRDEACHFSGVMQITDGTPFLLYPCQPAWGESKEGEMAYLRMLPVTLFMACFLPSANAVGGVLDELPQIGVRPGRW